MTRVSSSLVSSLSASYSPSPSGKPARRASWLVKLASVLALTAPLAACADDDDDNDPPPPPTVLPITCTATISPGSFAYQVGDNGRMLVVAPGTINEETLERVGVPSAVIQGTWLIDDKLTAAGRLRAELAFGAADVTVHSTCTHPTTSRPGTVSVTASATITASQVTINGSATKSIQVK